jgi:hypothetical protein
LAHPIWSSRVSVRLRSDRSRTDDVMSQSLSIWGKARLSSLNRLG